MIFLVLDILKGLILSPTTHCINPELFQFAILSSSGITLLTFPVGSKGWPLFCWASGPLSFFRFSLRSPVVALATANSSAARRPFLHPSRRNFLLTVRISVPSANAFDYERVTSNPADSFFSAPWGSTSDLTAWNLVYVLPSMRGGFFSYNRFPPGTVRNPDASFPFLGKPLSWSGTK